MAEVRSALILLATSAGHDTRAAVLGFATGYGAAALHGLILADHRGQELVGHTPDFCRIDAAFLKQVGGCPECATLAKRIQDIGVELDHAEAELERARAECCFEPRPAP